MAELLRQSWSSDFNGPQQRDRRPCLYDAYLPDRLADRRFQLDGAVAATVAEAEAAINRFDADSLALTNTEALARLLLRAESVASSKIEGLEVGARRLLRAEAEETLGVARSDVTAREVLGNIEAMSWAIDSISNDSTISPVLLLEAHRRLLTGTTLEAEAGRLRVEQNWIGGSDYNPCSAAFVPPPPEFVPDLIQDLCDFCNSDALPAVAQAAVAHAQFETIHPFIDGNGRTGRVLVHLILRRRRLAVRILPPVSLILATWAGSYVDALTGTRHLGPPDTTAAYEGMNQWISLFAVACLRAVQDAVEFEARYRQLELEWRGRLGSVRRGSAVELLLRDLPGLPVLTVAAAAERIQRSFQQTNAAVARLADAGILTPINLRQRNRAFEARELVDAFTDLERRLASPEGDTRTSRPARLVPPRRARS
jgi:Fic family protein